MHVNAHGCTRMPRMRMGKNYTTFGKKLHSTLEYSALGKHSPALSRTRRVDIHGSTSTLSRPPRRTCDARLAAARINIMLYTTSPSQHYIFLSKRGISRQLHAPAPSSHTPRSPCRQPPSHLPTPSWSIAHRRRVSAGAFHRAHVPFKAPPRSLSHSGGASDYYASEASVALARRRERLP